VAFQVVAAETGVAFKCVTALFVHLDHVPHYLICAQGRRYVCQLATTGKQTTTTVNAYKSPRG
jgi:hypothetical protein